MEGQMSKLSYGELLYYWQFIEFVDYELKYIEEDYKKAANSYIPLNADDDVAAIFETDDEIIISFNGSSTLREWIGNFRFSPHGGFHKNFHKIADKFYKQIKDLISLDGKPITLVGHSRGGLCLIVGYLLRKLDAKNLRVITFGSPRVATRKGLKKLKAKGVVHHRVSAGRDIVDNLPFNFLLFKHYETEFYKLKNVEGKFDHTSFREALLQEIE
jgi:hypothetical protein